MLFCEENIRALLDANPIDEPSENPDLIEDNVTFIEDFIYDRNKDEFDEKFEIRSLKCVACGFHHETFLRKNFHYKALKCHCGTLGACIPKRRRF